MVRFFPFVLLTIVFVTGPMGWNSREECSSGAAAVAAAAGWSNYFMSSEKWTRRTVLDIGRAGGGAEANVTQFAARELDFAYPWGNWTRTSLSTSILTLHPEGP